MDSRAFWAESSPGTGSRSPAAGATSVPGLSWTLECAGSPSGKRMEGGSGGGNIFQGPGPSSGKSRGGLVLPAGLRRRLRCWRRRLSPLRQEHGQRPAPRAPFPAVPQWGTRLAWGDTSHEGVLPGLRGLFAMAPPLGRISVAAERWCRGAGMGVGVPVPPPSARCSPPRLPDAQDCRSDVGNRLPSSLACD